jgi:hypothetical protein
MYRHGYGILSIAAGIFALLYHGFGAALPIILSSLDLFVPGIELITTGIIGRRLVVP